MGTEEDSGRKSKLENLLNESVPAKPARKRPSRKVKAPSVTVSGTGNVIGDGNTVTNNIVHFPPTVKKRVVVKTGDGVIDAEQRFILKGLVESIVDTEKKIRRTPRSFAAVWKAFQNRFRISSYHELPADKFEAARKYLTTDRARVMSAKSAPKKLGDDFVKKRISAIQARSREFVDGTAKRKAFMAREFGAASLTELNPEQIEKVYRYVMNW